jgi:hypothetical protein
VPADRVSIDVYRVSWKQHENRHRAKSAQSQPELQVVVHEALKAEIFSAASRFALTHTDLDVAA